MTDYNKLRAEHGHKIKKRSRSAKKGAKSVRAEPWLYPTKPEQHAQVIAMSATHNQSAVAKHVGVSVATVKRWVAAHEDLAETELRAGPIHE